MWGNLYTFLLQEFSRIEPTPWLPNTIWYSKSKITHQCHCVWHRIVRVQSVQDSTDRVQSLQDSTDRVQSVQDSTDRVQSVQDSTARVQSVHCTRHIELEMKW